MQRMVLNIRLFVLCAAVALGSYNANAQELNLGLNFSPIIGMPVMDNVVTNFPGVKAQRFNVNATAGLNINVRVKDFCVETGANLSSRSVVFKLKVDDYNYNNLSGSSSISAQNRSIATGYSFSVPLILGYKLSHHELKTNYDLFGLLGSSYDNYTFFGYSYTSSSTTAGGGSVTSISTNTNNSYPLEGNNTSWINIIAGFKIHAILRKVGLVEYGIRYHYPLSNAGKYSVNTIVTNNTYGSVFGGDFYPRLSYFDFHFTYYFLNLEAGTGRKKYRYN